MTRTRVQQVGDSGEALVATRLSAAGWTILGRQVRVGRAEIDLLALDPGPPRRLVAVEVRWRSTRDWGLPEETVDHRKLVRLRDALSVLIAQGSIAGNPLPVAIPALDVVALEPGRRDGGSPSIRHHRNVG